MVNLTPISVIGGGIRKMTRFKAYSKIKVSWEKKKQMYKKYMVIFCIAVICPFRTAYGNTFKPADIEKKVAQMKPIPDTIIPIPRQIKVLKSSAVIASGGKYNCEIIIPPNASEKIKISANDLAEEISRLARIIDRPPIREKLSKRADAVKIYLGLFSQPIWDEQISKKLRVTLKSPGPQGYVIYPKSSKEIFVAGSDDQGVIYGIYSLCQLLRKDGDKVQLQLAKIKDWPSFKWRAFAIPYPERNINRFLWLAKNLKINMLVHGATDAVTNMKMRKRGLYLGCGYWDYQKLPKTPNCGPNPNIATCWSDPRRKELYFKLRQACAKRHAGFVFTHDATDAGYWKIYRDDFWGKRCKRCRKVYGNDLAKADADAINNDYKAIKSVDKDCLLVVTIPCYYDNPFKYKDMQEYLIRLSKLIPKDVIIVIESPCAWPEHARAYKKFLNREIIMYQYAMQNGYCLTPTMLEIAEYPDGVLDGYFFSTGALCVEPANIAAACYMWNKHLPTDKSYFYNQLIPTCLKFLYGDAWKVIAKVVYSSVPCCKPTAEIPAQELRRRLAFCKWILPQMQKYRDAVHPRGKKSYEALLKNYTPLMPALEKALLIAEGNELLKKTKKLVRQNKLDKLRNLLSNIPSCSSEENKLEPMYILNFMRDIIINDSKNWQTQKRKPILDDDKTFRNKKVIRLKGNFNEGLYLVMTLRGSPGYLLVNGKQTVELTPSRNYRAVELPLPPAQSKQYVIKFEKPKSFSVKSIKIYPGYWPVGDGLTISLNDVWKFKLDPEDIGIKEKWYSISYKWKTKTWVKIKVPGCWESALPEAMDYDGTAWYRYRFRLPDNWNNLKGKHKILLIFGGFDDGGMVYFNGKFVGKRMEYAQKLIIDITKEVKWNDDNFVAVRVIDNGGGGGIIRSVYIRAVDLSLDKVPKEGPGALHNN